MCSASGLVRQDGCPPRWARRAAPRTRVRIRVARAGRFARTRTGRKRRGVARTTRRARDARRGAAVIPSRMVPVPRGMSCYGVVFDHEETRRGWGGSTRGGAHLLMGPVEAADADVHHAALARGAVHRRGALERHVRQVHHRAVGGGYPANLRPDHGETTVVTPARVSGGAGAGNAPKRTRSGERGPKANHRGDVRGHLSCGESSGPARAR